MDPDGRVYTVKRYDVQSASPGFWLDETGPGRKSAFFVLDEFWMQVQRRAQGFGAYEASPFYINVNAPHISFVVSASGNVGFRKWNPSHPLDFLSGAFVSAGGVFTNASSREYKTDIKQLTAEKAMDALTQLEPVEFAYKADAEERHVGFIAEDAPDIVVSKDRKGMSPMDVVAVLTKVVQEQQKVVREQRRISQAQQKTIDELSEKVAELEGKLRTNKDSLTQPD